MLILTGCANWGWLSPSLGLHLFNNEREVLIYLKATGEIVGSQKPVSRGELPSLLDN